jgi:hypothetical protein
VNPPDVNPIEPGVDVPAADIEVTFGDFGDNIIIMDKSLSEKVFAPGRLSDDDDPSGRQLVGPDKESGKLKKEPILVVLSILRLPQVADDKSPARGEGKCCTISSKSNLKESLVSVDPGFALGGTKFISLESVGVSAVMLKLPSKLTCLSSDNGDSSGPLRL